MIDYSQVPKTMADLKPTTFTPINTTIFFNETSGNTTDGTCVAWLDAQHALFQLANLCMVISFLTPSNFKHHCFFLRLMLNFGFLFLVIWSAVFICMPDVFAWNLVFLFVNMFHLAYLGYQIIPQRFSKTCEDVYAKTFKPLKVSRRQFRDIAQFGNILVLAKGAVYAKEGNSRCGQKLSMLLKGRLKVTFEGLFLHFIEVNQFVDSPEYDSVKTFDTEEKFQVSISATEDSLLISWPHRRLKNHLTTDKTFENIFHQLVGKDISHKLYQIQEKLMSNPNYMEALASRHSSMVNVRNSIVSMSTVNLQKLNCLQACRNQTEEPSTQTATNGAYESCV